MGQMKETLHDDPNLTAYEGYNATRAISKLSEELLSQVNEVEFTLRVLTDTITDFLKELES